MNYITRDWLDREIGWDVTPSTTGHEGSWCWSSDQDGARLDLIETSHPLIHVYGDSFAQGVEVNDWETWPYYLEDITGRDVKNYGVYAYGTWQAILKLEKRLQLGDRPQIVILSIYEDNIERVVNSNRYFIGGMLHPLAFSPWLRWDGRVVVSHPNDFLKSHGMDLPREILRAAYYKSAENDFFAPLRVRKSFPYSLELLRYIWENASRTLAVPGGNLWDSTEGRAVTDHIFTRYLALARTFSFRPLVVMIPDVQQWKIKRLETSYADYLRYAQSRFQDITFVDIASVDFEREKFNVKPFKGHSSPYGNKIIAITVSRALESSPRPGNGGLHPVSRPSSPETRSVAPRF